MNKNIALVCNPLPEARKSVEMADVISVSLRQRGIQHSIFTAYWPVLWENFTDAWIIGGDGTLNRFINNYPDIKLPLCLFAGGTGNDFHWLLYGKQEVQQQVDHALSGRNIWVDAGICNGHLFLNGVGIGFDGAIVKDLIGKRKLAGKATYLLSILKNLVGFKETSCVIRMNNEKREQDCFMISVANGQRYGGGFLVAPTASYTDELLDVNIVGAIPPFKRLRYLPVIEKGEHLNLPFIHHTTTREVLIVAAKDLPAHLDGEFFPASEFKISCLPKRFCFVV